MIRFDLDLAAEAAVPAESSQDVVDVRQPANGMLAATEGERSASTSASGA